MEITFDILNGCKNCERTAQKKLYEWCYTQYIRLCMRYNTNHEDARLALNTGFMKIIKGLDNVPLEGLHFISWSKRIMTNTLIDEYRKNKNRLQVVHMKEDTRELENLATGQQNEGEMNLTYQEILDLLKTIPPISAHVFTLYVIDGYNHREIGELLEITDGTSKWHLSTARKLLRDRLEMSDIRNTKTFSV